MKKLLSLCLFLSTFFAFSQDFEISGILQDENGVAVESATVYVESAKDSTIISYTISDSKGAFLLEGRTKEKNVGFYVTYTGMKPIKKAIDLSKPKIDFETLVLQENTEQLNEVVVVADRSPIQIKKDTLQFNASSFKTSSDANVETLLKKLPGVNVDKDGNITVNGKKVNKILVNGKEFFGNDPKIATKNLPKEIIDKIQVVDTKTKEEAFTGQDGKKEEKTINITIKEDKNKGLFGRVTAGYGTDERYALSGILNYFNDKERLSVLGGRNNVNTSGFNSDEVRDMGGDQYSYVRVNGVWTQSNPLLGGTSDGITETTTAGIHYANEWEKKSELTTDYFFDRKDTRTASSVYRETYLPTDSYTTEETNSGNRLATGHNFNLDFEIKPDTMTRISITPKIVKSYGDNFTSNSSSRRDSNDALINTSQVSNNSDFDNLNAGVDGYISRRFKNKGEFLSLWLSADIENSDLEDRFMSQLDYTDGVTPSESNNQLKLDETKTYRLNTSLNFNKLIKGNWFYTLGMRVGYEGSERDRRTFDFDNTTQDYSIINTGLTNNYKTKTTQLQPSAGLKYRNKDLTVRMSLGYNSTKLSNEDLLANTAIDNTFENMTYRASIWKKFSQSKSLWANISSNWSTPSFQQLQPIQDNSNPLNLVEGNPNLKATNRIFWHVGYRNFDFKTRSGYGLNANMSLSNNAVVSNRTTDLTTLVSTTRYENLDGFYWLSVGGYYDKKHKFDKHSLSWRANVDMSQNRTKGYINNVEYTTNSTGVTPSISLTYNYNDLFEISPSYNYTFNKVDYSIDQAIDTDFGSSNLSIQLETFWPKMIEFSNDFKVLYNPNVAPGFTKTAYMWNASVGVKMLKDKGLLKLKVFDLLNQNTSVSRYTSQDYLQDTENLVLEQYFMLSFTYKVNKFKGSKG